MRKNRFWLAVLAASALTGCQSAPGSDEVQGNKDAALYLRGDMNDYSAQPEFLLKDSGEEGRCASAEIKADWSPYKFKFADKDWTPGTNFGFAKQPFIDAGGAEVLLNPNSKFEDISFSVKQSGVYRFCLIKRDGQYFATVKAVKP
ncbi:MAG: pullulanase [Succinivibrio sp.]|nr:pullulanase [Succinivibrio sp.]